MRLQLSIYFEIQIFVARFSEKMVENVLSAEKRCHVMDFAIMSKRHLGA
jgi:hypothetical protein